MSDCMSRTGIAGGTTDSTCWLPLGVFCLFLGAGYTGDGFCDNEVPTDGERDLAFFAAYHYHIPSGFCLLDVLSADTVSG